MLPYQNNKKNMPPVCRAYMSNHHSVAIPTECFLQESSQLAVPVVHIPKCDDNSIIVHIPKCDDGKGGYSYDDNDIIVHIPKCGGGDINNIIVHVPKRDDGKGG